MDQINNQETKKPRLELAFLYSFLVMLAGAILWGVFYYLGIFSAWVSFLSVWCAIMVYIKYYNKTDWKMYLWVIAFSIVLNIISLFIVIAAIVASEAGVSLGEALSAVFMVLEADSELMGTMAYDMIMSILFTVVGVVISVISIKKKRKQDAEKAEEMNNMVNNLNNQVVENKEDNQGKNYLSIIEALTSHVKTYIENQDKEEFNKNIDEFKNNYILNLTADELALLKQKAQELLDTGSVVQELELACNIILKI